MLLDDLEGDSPLCVRRMAQLHERNSHDPRYPHVLAEAVVSGSAALERAGGWLLRRHVQAGRAIPAEDWAIVVDGLDHVRSHIGRLLYQLLNDRPELMEAAPAEMAEFLRAGLKDKRASIRAWSLSALDLLARRHAQYRPEVRRAVKVAQADDEPCVKARLRRMEARRRKAGARCR